MPQTNELELVCTLGKLCQKVQSDPACLMLLAGQVGVQCLGARDCLLAHSTTEVVARNPSLPEALISLGTGDGTLACTLHPLHTEQL